MQSRYELDWSVLVPYFGYYMEGLGVTLGLAATALALSLALGLLLALLGRSSFAPFRLFVAVYVWLFRAVPIYVYLLFVYYGLPILLGINFSPIVAGLICLGSQYAAFQSEVFRAGLGAISRGQVEAALTVGLTRVQAFMSVVLPQVVRLVLPASGNNFVIIVKETSLVAIIGVYEITRYTQLAVADTFRAFEFYTALAVLYGMVVLSLTVIVNRLEHRFAIPSYQ